MIASLKTRKILSLKGNQRPVVSSPWTSTTLGKLSVEMKGGQCEKMGHYGVILYLLNACLNDPLNLPFNERCQMMEGTMDEG